jgi:tRNA pseudouridine55 synthase
MTAIGIDVDGILNINKPQGKTSFSVVAMVKQLTGERRVGHAGTLDPAATGVLPICLGQGTRVIEFLAQATKAYRAQVELGVATDTYDATGKVTYRRDSSRISQGRLEAALDSFRGSIQQTPPMYSAVKYQGKRLYELARAGIEVNRQSRPVRIHRLDLIEWQPPLVTIEIVCDKGTYIRSIAHDLGQSLGCGANLKSLTRLRYGVFDIEDAVPLPQLESAFHHGYWQRLIYPIDVVLSHWTAMVVSEQRGQEIRHGRPLALEYNPSKQHIPSWPSFESHCRAYTLDGCFLAVLYFNPQRGEWQPKKVFQ